MVTENKIRCLGEFSEMPSYKLWEMNDYDLLVVKFLDNHKEIVEGIQVKFEQSFYYLIFLYLALRLQKQGLLYFVEKVNFGENNNG